MSSNKFLKEIEANIKELARETDDFKKSEFFKNYLETMSKFWQYSYHNQLLIHFALPAAKRVSGFRTWQLLNRKVKKGAKAIKILAPYIRKNKEEEIASFFPVSVFDISQTEGEELPEIKITVEGDNYKVFLEKLTAFCKEREIKVNFSNLGINGLYGYSKGGEIAISDSESINTQTNTIIHEIAHELLHRKSELSKEQKEIQAESVAYVVTKHFNLENKSFNYLALYDADYNKIIENLKAIAEASKEIIEFLEEKIVWK